MKTLIIYHKADFDGICSGEICRHFNPGADMLGWDYGDPVPDVSDYHLIYLVDISIGEILEQHGLKVIWIDHHKTAIEKWEHLKLTGWRIDGVAACRLCWQWFHRAGHPPPTLEDFRERRVQEPELIRLLGEYDVWDRRDPDAATLQLGMKAAPIDWQFGPVWLSSRFLTDRICEGCVVHAYLEQEDARLIERGGWTFEWEGFRFLCFNGHGNSRVFEVGIRAEHDGLCLWSHNGSKVIVSLYGVPDHPEHDFSGLAAKYGGGGHRQACGFNLSLLEWVEILRVARGEVYQASIRERNQLVEEAYVEGHFEGVNGVGDVTEGWKESRAKRMVEEKWKL